MNSANENNRNEQLPSQESAKMIDELQSKYGVDRQEVLNAVIAANNDQSKAEDYLRERTERK